MKSYTDIEQSKKLAEILPFKSVDMWYWEWPTAPEYNNYEHPMFHQGEDIRNIPCWSLAALIGVLPRVDIEKETWSDDTYDYRVKAYIDDGYVGDWFDNPIDACYDMIIKLHEDKLL